MYQKFPELVNPRILYRLHNGYKEITQNDLYFLVEGVKRKIEKSFDDLFKDEFVGFEFVTAIYNGPLQETGILNDTMDLELNSFYSTPTHRKILFKNLSSRKDILNYYLEYERAVLNEVKSEYECGPLNIECEIIGYLDKISPIYNVDYLK